MSKLDTWIDNKIAQNIIVWVFIFVIFLISIQSDSIFLTALAIVSFIAIPVYLNNLIILPLLLKKPRARGVIYFFINITLSTFLAVYLASDFLVNFRWPMLLNFFGILLLVLFFSSSLKLTRDSFIRRQQEKEAELKLLKAQLNPHFLFNTLNNLYGLSVIKSDKLPNLMLKLSDLLRYSLYDTKEQLVPLKKEIEYLENYMSLEKIRLEDKTEIRTNITASSDTWSIAPMLLIVFVENAFKHLGTTSAGDNYVAVTLGVEGNALKFKCENTIDKNALPDQNMEKGKSGIGLQNAKKRLALIYPESHELMIERENEKYTTDLILRM